MFDCLKNITTTLLLLAYLASVFQQPLLEGLHFLAHLTVDHGIAHSFHHHADHTHTHDVLSQIEENEQDGSPLQQLDPPEKVLKYIELLQQSQTEKPTLHSLVFDYKNHHFSFSIAIPKPPPKAFLCS